MKSIMFPITQCSLKAAVSVRRGIGSIQCLKMPQSINKNNHHYPHIDLFILNIFGCQILAWYLMLLYCWHPGEHLIVVYKDEQRGH